MNWQPIETAPTDATEVLVSFRECGECQYRIASYDELYGVRCWIDYNGHVIAPTYWRPLVPPEDE